MLIQILNGLVYGGLLYIVSVGLVLIFGLRRIVNFAHGSLFMIGAYIGFSVAAVEGFWGAALAATVIMGLIGALLDLTVFQPLRRQDSIVTVLVTFGLLMVLEDFAQTIWGKDYLKMPVPPLLSGSVSIFGDSFPAYRLFVIVVAGAVALGLSAWLRASRIGLYVRAASAGSPLRCKVSTRIVSASWWSDSARRWPACPAPYRLRCSRCRPRWVATFS